MKQGQHGRVGSYLDALDTFHYKNLIAAVAVGFVDNTPLECPIVLVVVMVEVAEVEAVEAAGDCTVEVAVVVLEPHVAVAVARCTLVEAALIVVVAAAAAALVVAVVASGSTLWCCHCFLAQVFLFAATLENVAVPLCTNVGLKSTPWCFL